MKGETTNKKIDFTSDFILSDAALDILSNEK